MSFVTPDILSKLGALTSTAADRAEFGIFQLDDGGRVLLCNRAGCELIGIQRAEVPGRNIFDDILPSTRNPLFQGRFTQGLASGELNQAFEYTLQANDRWIDVLVHLVRHKLSRTNWLFLQKCPEAADSWHGTLANLREQLSALYQERSSPSSPFPPSAIPSEVIPAPDAASAPDSTTESLKQEITRLAHEKKVLESELQALKRRARDIGAAMFEAALLGKKITMP